MSDDWRGDLEVWLAPFLAAMRHKTRRRFCPAYIAGLIGPGDRKSVQPMAARNGEFGYDQLHHFVVDRLVGDEAGYLVIDDTALPKKGSHSVGVAAQYASSLGKTSNCQSLVSVTLVSREVPVMVGLRLFLPESWTGGSRIILAKSSGDCSKSGGFAASPSNPSFQTWGSRGRGRPSTSHQCRQLFLANPGQRRGTPMFGTVPVTFAPKCRGPLIQRRNAAAAIHHLWLKPAIRVMSS
jgi:hypothetical protein